MHRLPRLLMIIGSGELAPQMTRGQRLVVNRLAGERGRPADVRAVVVDTPFGFQSNADALSETLVDHFARRLGMSTSIASFRRADGDTLARESAFARVREADLVFAGPGSPSYALRQWSASTFGELLADKLINGGALVFASAAALTLGRLTVPVYELYKVGADPYWLPGLDVLSTIGISAAVIPHFDNAEGPGHDTRYCFLGEGRLTALESAMPADVFVLGIDEHTALLLDLDAEVAFVHGRGGVTIRRHGQSTRYEAGEQLSLAALRNVPEVGMVAAVQALPTDDNEANAELARRVIELTDESSSATERARLVEPLIEALLEVRREARRAGDYATADGIRDRLSGLGIEIADSAEGTTDYRITGSNEPDAASDKRR